jgi:hypothetical protein
MSFFFRITKCTFHKYGPSGTIERHDAMCVLALNIINEKIYVMLWFWLIILAVMTSLYMVSYSFNAYIIWGKWKTYL